MVQVLTIYDRDTVMHYLPKILHADFVSGLSQNALFTKRTEFPRYPPPVPRFRANDTIQIIEEVISAALR